jgi:hypothetical protein
MFDLSANEPAHRNDHADAYISAALQNYVPRNMSGMLGRNRVSQAEADGPYATGPAFELSVAAPPIFEAPSQRSFPERCNARASS